MFADMQELTKRKRVKVVGVEDAAFFEIDGERYEFPLKDSQLRKELDQWLAKIPINHKEFKITVPYLFAVDGLGNVSPNKYLAVDLSIKCKQSDNHYISDDFWIKRAYLRGKHEDDQVEREKIVKPDDFLEVRGMVDSRAVRQHGKLR